MLMSIPYNKYEDGVSKILNENKYKLFRMYFRYIIWKGEVAEHGSSATSFLFYLILF